MLSLSTLVIGAAGSGVLGLGAGIRLSRWLIANRPTIAARLKLTTVQGSNPLMDDDYGPPAIPLDSIPLSIDPTEAEKIENIPHLPLRRLLTTLVSWTPKRHWNEDGYQLSFERHLLNTGYGEEQVKRHKYVRWTAHDRDPIATDKPAIPDFQIEDTVLAELKRNINASGESDRSLGQMQRYSVAWRRKGPTLLVVCNEYDASLRVHIDKTVRGWKAQGGLVMAYWVRRPNLLAGDDEFPADNSNKGPRATK